MKDFETFLEGKDKDSDRVSAMMDIAHALQSIFKKYTLSTREKVWKELTSKKGEEEIKKLIRTPTRSLSTFRSLV